jgi:hypothetical protein
MALTALQILNALDSNSKFEYERVAPLLLIECMHFECAEWAGTWLAGVMLLHH